MKTKMNLQELKMLTTIVEELELDCWEMSISEIDNTIDLIYEYETDDSVIKVTVPVVSKYKLTSRVNGELS